MIELVDAGQLQPSTYNPRRSDEARLAMVELSLRKLGFLLPLFATRDGEIVSGHQRHLVATERLGWRELPVSWLEDCSLIDRKALNVAFNRATNDMTPGDLSEGLVERLAESRADVLGAGLPDIGDEQRFRCMRPTLVPSKMLQSANEGRWRQEVAYAASVLAGRGIHMPIICRQGWRVVNGMGRLEYALEKLVAELPVVLLDDAEAEFAQAMLNLLTMDFTIHERYADVLRHNSMRRGMHTRSFLGRGFTFAAGVDKIGKEFDIRKVDDYRAWVAVHGKSVLDFGAGQREETRMLNEVGIDCTPFEPYCMKPQSDDIDKDKSVELTRAFLSAVAAGKQWSSIFCSAVLNSVPFLADRQKIVRIIAALCGSGSKVYSSCVAVTSGRFAAHVQAQQGEVFNRSARNGTFALTYEPNVFIGQFYHGLPKVQKYHDIDEFAALWAECFARVLPMEVDKENVQVIASATRPLRRKLLREALEHEFDLPYPDESRMGLVGEAVFAFSKRLGVEL